MKKENREYFASCIIAQYKIHASGYTPYAIVNILHISHYNTLAANTKLLSAKISAEIVCFSRPCQCARPHFLQVTVATTNELAAHTVTNDNKLI